MITDSKYPTEPRELYGLSSDTKPVNEFNGLPVTNGSVFVEIDTGKVYAFSAETSAWIAI